MNKLSEEKSPYLLQHAFNPVNWYPWGEEAFAASQESNKLIFLSVGYSTCHWCHVMERESFENTEVAEIMNEHFINVKVDREERPDVDKVYMSFVQATTGGGGWPMSVFLTPTLKPIYGGTYFPPEDQMFGRPGFKTILKALSSKWEQQRDMMIESGDKIIQAMEKSTMEAGENTGAKPPPNGEIVAKTCFGQLLQNYDSDMGGFSKAPKFPQPVNFNFLFTYNAANPKDDKAKQGLKMVLHTLDMMAKGGIHDHISQGFARYSTDANWHVPHFEKMLYDQAQLSVAYSHAYQATKDEKFSAIVEDIMTYVKRDLGHPLGAFYSAEDADSKARESDDHKREGAFCVWTHQQLTDLLKKHTFQGNDQKEHNLLQLCEAYFNAKPGGNVDPRGDPHGELKNQNHFTTIGIDKEKIIKDFGLENEAALNLKVKDIQEILYAERQKRPRPHLDNKILTSWNGLMISGFAVSGMALHRPDYIEKAVQAAEFIRSHMFDEDKGTLLRSIYTSSDGNVEQLNEPIHGFVDDYAFLIQGLLDLYHATFDEKWIKWADQLQNKQNQLFWDEKGYGYFTAPEGDESIVLRLKEDQDGAEPSANSISSLNLLRLFAYTENKSYQEMSGQIFNSYETTLVRFPVALPAMTAGLLMFHKSPLQIIIAGPEKEAKPLIDAVNTLLLPQKILIRAPDEQSQKTSLLYQKLDVLKDIPTKQAKAYVCRNYACSQPVETPEALIKLIQEQ